MEHNSIKRCFNPQEGEEEVAAEKASLNKRHWSMVASQSSGSRVAGAGVGEQQGKSLGSSSEQTVEGVTSKCQELGAAVQRVESQPWV